MPKKKKQNQPLSETALPIWLKFVLATSMLFAVCATGFSPVFNNDLGFHIRIGDTIWENRSVPTTDHHSHTADGAIYLDQEWMSQVVLYWIDRVGGITGLAVFKGLFLLSAFGLLFWASRGNWLAASTVMLACVVIVIPRVQMRPHLISWIFIGALLVFFRKGSRIGIALALLLWANFHASFILAVLMSLIWAAEQYWQTREKKWFGWAAAFLVAPCINPFGPKIYLYAMHIKENVWFVSEWKPYPITSGYLWLFILFMVILAVDVLRKKEGRIFDAGRMALLGALSTKAMRMVPVGMLYLAPTASRRYSPMISRLGRTGAIAWGLAVSVGALSLGGYMVAKRDGFQLKIAKHALPVAATDFVLRHDLSGKMFNDYNFGGYLLWKAWPKYKVFVDGRLEIYGQDRTLDNYLKTSAGERGWDRVLNGYGIDFCVVRADRNIARALSDSPDWELVYFDYNAAIFVRKGTHPELFRLYLLTPWGNRDRKQIARSIEEARYLINENPDFFGGYKILAFLLYRSGDMQGAREGMKKYLSLHPEGTKSKETQKMIRKLSAKGYWP